MILTNVREWDVGDKLPEYEDVLEFLKFIHNYVIPIYGTKNMRKWIKIIQTRRLSQKLLQLALLMLFLFMKADTRYGKRTLPSKTKKYYKGRDEEGEES